MSDGLKLHNFCTTFTNIFLGEDPQTPFLSQPGATTGLGMIQALK